MSMSIVYGFYWAVFSKFQTMGFVGKLEDKLQVLIPKARVKFANLIKKILSVTNPLRKFWALIE